MPAGAIQFVADASQLTTESEKARKSVSSVAASAEDARKRIVESYKAQVEAAKDAGASQRELESITRRSSSMLASVSEDSANRYINAIDRMEERTRRFNAARSNLTSAVPSAPVSSFSFAGYGGEAKEADNLSHALDGVSAAHTRGVSSAVQFGAVIRGVEGNFSRNVRAAEVFGSTISALGPIMEFAFPVVGAAALGYALFEMGNHAYQAFERVVMLRDAINGLNKLQINVASTVNKDNDSAEASVESILEATQGRSASLRQRYSYQQQKPLDLSSYFYADGFKNLPTDVKANYETQYKSIAPNDLPARLQSIRNEVTQLQDAIKTTHDPNSGGFVPVIGGYGPSALQNPSSYYEARLKAAQQIQSQLDSGSVARSAGLQNLQVEIPKADNDEQLKAAQARAEAQRKASEASRKEAEEFRQTLDVDLALWKQGQEYANNIAKITHEYTSDFYKTQGLSSDDTQKLGDSGKTANTYIQSLSQSIDLHKQNSTAIAQSALQMAVATGQMTKLDAAQVTANMHSEDYADALLKLQQQRDSISASSEYDNNPLGRRTALQQNQNSIDALNAGRGIQVTQDAQNANPSSSSPFVGATDALNEFVISTRDAARQLSDFTTSTINGFNDVLLKVLTTRSTGLQNHEAFANYGAGLFRSVAGTGLQKVEGTALGAFGFGSAAKLGTQTNPMYVRLADAVGSAASSVGGFLGNLFGGNKGPGQSGLSTALGISSSAMSNDQSTGGLGLITSAASTFLPMLASGGQINGPAIVGEVGPEIWMPPVPGGKIIPNRQLNSIGGGPSHTFNIDASGSTDPAQTQAAVTRGIQAAAPHLMAGSVHAVSEQQKRKPNSMR